MPCGKGLLTTSPNSPTKAISHMVLFGEHMFLDPTTCGYRVWKYSQRCMVHLAKNCIGTGYVFMLLFDTPFPGLKQHYNWYGTIGLPIGF